MVSRRTRFLLWWRRTGMGARVAVLAAGAILLALLVYGQGSQDESEFRGANLLVFSLVNLNIVILCVLIFLVGRNVVKLVFDRKRKVLGSQLRMRLVLAFVGLALIPTIIIFLLASGMVNRAMESWFKLPVDASVSGSVEIARHHYLALRDFALTTTRRMADEIEDKPLFFKSAGTLHDYLEKERQAYKLFSLTLYGANREPVVQAQNAAAMIDHFSEPPPDEDALDKAYAGERLGLFEETEASNFVRVYCPTRHQGSRAVLVGTMRMDPELADAIMLVNDSYKEYGRLKLFRGPLRSGNLLALAMITGLILFAAIWIGFFIAREITVPIQRLAEATRAVARGNYDFQIRVAGDDEISFLVRSFNTMTADLKQSRNEAERRRLYLETILAKLAVSVIAVDTRGRITSVNAAAKRLFGFEEGEFYEGRELTEVLSPMDYRQIAPLLDAIDVDGARSEAVDREMDLIENGRVRRVVCTAGPIEDTAGKRLGSVLLFDDVTDLIKAQQMAAWREVARRIAHEIKNPLTPIQLSAQRLQKLLGQGEMQAVVSESTQTIVEHVHSIKRLADEFSKFARMPAAEFSMTNLNAVISEVVSSFGEHQSDAVLQFIADSSVPEVAIDKEQIRRILINLIDNALAACSGDNRKADEPPRVTVKTQYRAERGLVSFEVADNGPGIPRAERSRIFEPYVTGKEGGTGLGLAIVASLVADHHGEIKVFDNTPRGARFVVELPTAARAGTQRRLAHA